METLNVGVFCSARDNIDKELLSTGYELGRALAINEYKVVTGASVSGLMGTVARGVSDYDGYNIGVYPRELEHLERPYPYCDEFYVEDKLIDRQAKLIDLSDAFIVCPGGLGTMYELFEVLTKMATGVIPESDVILLNVNGFYDELISLLIKLDEENTISMPPYLYIARNIDDVMCILNDELDPIEV